MTAEELLHFVDETGLYIGSFYEDDAPDGAIQVPDLPPADARVWNGAQWVPARYYVDDAGTYLGAFVGALPPVGAIEVAEPPADARQTYDFGAETWRSLAEAIPDITRRQLRLWMFGAGHDDAAIRAAIETLAEPERSQALIEYEDATTFQRSHHLFDLLGPAFGLAPADIDLAFREAARL
ncbi:hypothetical protein [Chelatococcus sp. XZ-Ab1]|uniref:hypothetical protein n=1 Tax=Chelatococcus sp. XZ-Ab1 TaxID=3034027 RepID=UPI0023E36D91|nr:hypothetical protein [Chelatococcus sp. XZ-Ab1]